MAAWSSGRHAGVPAVERASVWTAIVRRGTLTREVPLQGTLVPESVQWLSAGSAARVARIAVRPGARVEPDTVVVVLENAELELASLEAERQAASVAAAMIELDVRASAERSRQEATIAGLTAEGDDASLRARSAVELASAGVMSELDQRSAESKAKGLSDRLAAEHIRRSELDQGKRRQLAAQRDELLRLQKIAQFRRGQLEALQVRAGIAGVIQEIPLESGMWVTAGSVLARVARPDALKARGKVAEGNAQELRSGLVVRFALPTGALRGRVESVDPVVSRGSVEIEVKLDDALPAGARVDQAVTGYVELERLDDVVFVQRPAGVRDAAIGTVFRLDADRRLARRRSARFGRGSVAFVELLDGLSPGDEIIVSDVSGWEASERVALE